MAPTYWEPGAIADVPWLEVRSPRGGGGGSSGGGGRGGGSSKSSSSSKTKSKTSSSKSSTSGSSAAISGGQYVGAGGARLLIPVWAIVLIVLLSLFTVAFISALIYYYQKERKKAGPTRHGHVWWKAFAIASLLWIPIQLIKCCTKRKYAKIATGTTKQAEVTGYAATKPGPRYGDGGGGDVSPSPYESYDTAAMPPPYSVNAPAPPSRSLFGKFTDYMRGHSKWRH